MRGRSAATSLPRAAASSASSTTVTARSPIAWIAGWSPAAATARDPRRERVGGREEEPAIPGIVGVVLVQRGAAAAERPVREELHRAHRREPPELRRAASLGHRVAELRRRPLAVEHRVDAQREVVPRGEPPEDGEDLGGDPRVVHRGDAEPGELGEGRPQGALELRGARRRDAGEHEVLRRVDEHPRRPPVARAEDAPPGRIRSPRVDPGGREGGRVHPQRVAVHPGQRRRVERDGARERALGREPRAGPAVLVPAAPAEPGPRRRAPRALGDARRAGLLVRSAGEPDLGAPPAEEREVPVRVREPRDAAPRVDADCAAARQPRAVRDGPDRDEHAVAGERRLRAGAVRVSGEERSDDEQVRHRHIMPAAVAQRRTLAAGAEGPAQRITTAGGRAASARPSPARAPSAPRRAAPRTAPAGGGWPARGPLGTRRPPRTRPAPRARGDGPCAGGTPPPRRGGRPRGSRARPRSARRGRARRAPRAAPC